jgi:hypothetical protein
MSSADDFIRRRGVTDPREEARIRRQFARQDRVLAKLDEHPLDAGPRWDIDEDGTLTIGRRSGGAPIFITLYGQDVERLFAELTERNDVKMREDHARL